jgi:hypothetical protein
MRGDARVPVRARGSDHDDRTEQCGALEKKSVTLRPIVAARSGRQDDACY